MLNFPKSQPQLASRDCLSDNYHYHPGILQVQILKLKLKEERQKDKNVYQSIKDKIATR